MKYQRLSPIEIPAALLDQENGVALVLEQFPEIREYIKKLKLNRVQFLNIVGNHGTGKDLWSRLILNTPLRSKQQYKVVKFANHLRDQFLKVIGDAKELDRLKRDTNWTFPQDTVVAGADVSGMTVRDAMIFIAESVLKRKHGPAFFIALANIDVHLTLRAGTSVIVTDQRDQKEYEMLKQVSEFLNVPLNNAVIDWELPQLKVV